MQENSGGYSDLKQFVRVKAIRVLLPYIIVGLFLCFLQHRELNQMLNGVSHLWFLMVIFECYVLGKMVEPILQLKKAPQLLLFVAIVFFTVLVPCHCSGIRILGFSLLLKYFPFYIMGMLGATVDFTVVAKYRKIIFLLLCISVICLLLGESFFRHPTLCNLLGIGVVVFLFAHMRMSHIGFLPNWLNSLDKCSMGIYIVHHIILQEMNGVTYFHELASTHYYIYPISQFILLTITSWGFVALCKKNKYSKYVLG